MGFFSSLFGRKTKIRLPDGGCIRMTDMLARAGSWDAVNRNVVRLDRRGAVIWRIESSSSPDEQIPYTRIALNHGALIAYSWAGAEYVVDLETGELNAGLLVR